MLTHNACWTGITWAPIYKYMQPPARLLSSLEREKQCNESIEDTSANVWAFQGHTSCCRRRVGDGGNWVSLVLTLSMELHLSLTPSWMHLISLRTAVHSSRILVTLFEHQQSQAALGGHLYSAPTQLQP